MDAIILAGGKGTRLRPLTDKIPKPVLPVGGRPFIESQFARLARCGVKRVIVSAQYRTAELKKQLKTCRPFGMKVEVRKEPRPMGTGGAIRFAWPKGSPFCLVLNGDVLSNFDIRPMVSHHCKSGAVVSLWVVPVKDPSAFGVIESQRGTGRISRFVEKPRPGQSSSRWINAGLYAMSKEVLDFIPRGKKCSVEREVFPALLEAGTRMSAFKAKQKVYWRDIGTLENYEAANRDVSSGRLIVTIPGGARLWKR